MTTTRFLLILFALLNLLFLAAARGWFDLASPDDPGRMSVELFPERIRILGQTPPPEVVAQANGSISSTEASEQPVCLAWVGLSAAQNNRLISLFSAAGIRAIARDVQVAASWRVRIPPLPTREAAEILTDNMALLGVDKSTVRVEEAGSTGFAIVLGETFRNRQNAERYLETVKAKGVHNAGIETRNTSERRVEATVSTRQAETLLDGEPFAKRHRPCSP